MSNIIDPRTGQPVGPSQDQVIQILQMHHGKITALTQQVIHMGIFMEYCFQQIEVAGVELDLGGFEEFAKEKYRLLQEEQDAMLKKQQQAPPPVTPNIPTNDSNEVIILDE